MDDPQLQMTMMQQLQLPSNESLKNKFDESDFKALDSFLMKEVQDFQITAIDLSAIVNSRLRMLNASEGSEEDYDDLINHLNSQTVILPKQIH
jgi:hypothetical protein